jgi:RNA polymerase sigma-70 factor (ECF subfamily)
MDLENALQKLSDDQRLVLALHYYLDLPIEEVAASLGISNSAAKSRVSRAVKALRPAVAGTEELK